MNTTTPSPSPRTANGLSPEQTLAANRRALVDILSAPTCAERRLHPRELGLELERFVIDRTTGHTVAYADSPGIRALLETWGRFFAPEERVFIDGHLFGYVGTIDVAGSPVGISISLEPGSQLEASVGPSTSAAKLMGALEAFDTQFAEVTREMGVDWELVAQGNNPHEDDPAKVPLIDKERYRLMDAYLSQTGRYARDMMRCSASTQVSVDLACGCGLGGRQTYPLAVALGPILSFLADNTVRWRGLAGDACPRMVRSRIWEQMDPDRCGTVPGTFDEGFGPEAYVDWLCGVRPILFTDEAGETYSTGSATEADIMSRRLLGEHELAHMLSMVFPDSRLKGFVEIRVADSLPPKLAGALTAFVKGLFYTPDVGNDAVRLLVDDTTEQDVADAWHELQDKGWDAQVYGRPVTEVVDELVHLAERGLAGDADAVLLKALTSLWRERRVPRDVLS